MPILQGRDFDSKDTAGGAKLVLVDSALVDHFFSGQNPIGKSIRIGGSGGNFNAADTPQYTIVGVVPHPVTTLLVSGKCRFKPTNPLRKRSQWRNS